MIPGDSPQVRMCPRQGCANPSRGRGPSQDAGCQRCWDVYAAQPDHCKYSPTADNCKYSPTGWYKRNPITKQRTMSDEQLAEADDPGFYCGVPGCGNVIREGVRCRTCYREGRNPPHTGCTCGADSCGIPHSHWCDKEAN